MGTWEEKRLGDIVIINPTIKIEKETEVPYIDIDKIEPKFRTVTNIETKLFLGQGSSKFSNSDTILARITPCLENRKIAQVKIDKNGFGSTELIVFRAKNKVANSSFVYYLISSDFVVLPAINSMSGASGRQRADKKFIQRLKLKLPDLKTQEKIADILSSYDDLIENNNRRIAILEQTAQEIYKEWFVRFRFPGHEKAHFENGIPKGWERKKLLEYYSTCSGGTPSRANSSYYENGKYYWVKTGEIRDNIIVETEEKITEEAIKKSSAKLLPEKSVIMAMYGVNIGILGYLDIQMTCNQACCVFKDKREFSSKHYLFYYLKFIREYLLLISFGAAQQNISQELIKNVKIIMPPDELLIQFENKIDYFYQTMCSLIKQNSNLIKQRDLLLPRLLNGKLEV